jgi:TRAP transporter TAXI family solute receptor
MRLDMLKIYLPVALLIAGAFVVTFQFVEPPPPDRLRIATGGRDGAYAAFARDYAAVLAKSDVTLEVVETSGSMENLDRLRTGGGDGVDIAFVQGGLGDPATDPDLLGVASLYYEPLWVFARAGEATGGRIALTGQRVAIGKTGSGTHALATKLLQANGLTGQVETVEIGGMDAIAALKAGQVDIALIVSGTRAAAARALIEDPALALVSVERNVAYARRFRFLSPLALPEGTLDLAGNVPPAEVALVAPAATLVARDDLHPALVGLVLQAAAAVHDAGDVLTEPGTFPSPRLVDFPLSDEAARYFKSGPSFFQRYLPFWIANLIDRLWILIIPLLTVLIPLVRIAPPAYHWRMRRKIYRWYRDLGDIEREVRATEADADRATQSARLLRLQEDVGRVEVPLSYAEDLYHLRLHIAFVRDLLFERPGNRGPDSLRAD